MSLIPSWAPNLHPLVIHFPIALLIAAAAVELIEVSINRPVWLGPAATSLYVAGAVAAVAAYLTGSQAASTVFIPGMAYPVVAAHRGWALSTAWYCSMLAIVRFAGGASGLFRSRSSRVALLVAGLIAVVLLQQTAERGARLVYEFGTGVMAAPGSR